MTRILVIVSFITFCVPIFGAVAQPTEVDSDDTPPTEAEFEAEEPSEMEQMQSEEEQFFGKNEFLPPEKTFFSPYEAPNGKGEGRRRLLREYLPPSLTSERAKSLGPYNVYVPDSSVSREFYSLIPEEISTEFDIPMAYNEYVQMYIDFFQKQGRKWFTRWYFRSGRYIPMLQPILREYGLPEDTIYLAMIESGFSTSAYSRARAMGIWQFIASTGEYYGLKINFWVDERRDPVMATHAAARFLNDLYQKFGSWHLAWAAYNAGGGKISRAIKAVGSPDFWDIRDTNHIRTETKHYVPKLIACAMIVKDPARFGFTEEMPRDKLAELEEIVLQGAYDFRVIARLAEVSVEEVTDLNPHFLRGMTEPGAENVIRLPVAAARKFIEKEKELKLEERFIFVEHTVKQGDKLASLAQRYSSRIEAIEALNNVSASNVKAGQKVKIPNLISPGLSQTEQSKKRKRSKWQARSSYDYEPNPALKGKTHTVKRGDNLWGIALKYNMPVEELLRVNGISPQNAGSISVGQRLTLYAPKASKVSPVKSSPKASAPKTGGGKQKTVVYEVKSGDSLWNISQRYGVDVNELLKQNNLGKRARIYPGQKLKITYLE